LNSPILRHLTSGNAALLPALTLAACTTATIALDTPKTVTGQPLPPYQYHEECLPLRPGDRIDYGFESSEPVAFNIHYHEGNAVLMPITRENSRADSGIFAPPVAQDYCLMWEAGAAGTVIDYWIKVRRAGS
jgi:hypothetical protein